MNRSGRRAARDAAAGAATATPNEFCTLFDVNYLPRGLVLHDSLAETCPSFRLRVFCMDSATYEILDELALPSLIPIPLSELEARDPGLRAVKGTRSEVEYLWTATPAVSLVALEREPELELITYLDADLMFFADPAPLFEELGGRSTLIVPHRYAPRWEQSAPRFGTYNVEFMTFRRDERGLAALRWWHERCLEWCYAREDNGRFGDQKYLDEWPERFEGVHVLEHLGGGVAPWNVSRYTLSHDGDELLVDGRPVIFFHYHSLRLHHGLTRARRLGFLADSFDYFDQGPVTLVWNNDYPISAVEYELLWAPYLERLSAKIATVQSLTGRSDRGFRRVKRRSVAYEVARELARRSRGRGGPDDRA